jgi:hypothetical protein
MPIRVRKTRGPVTIGKRSASVSSSRRRRVGVSVGTRGVRVRARILPGVSFWTRLFK